MCQAIQRALLFMSLILSGMAPAVAQDCRSNIPPNHPNGRLIDQRNGTVTDSATGLMWKQCPEGQSGALCAIGSAEGLSWQQALQRGADTSFAGYSDWRLPNKNELESLVERSCVNPAISTTAFPNTPGWWFWSSTPNGDYSAVAFAWGVGFDFGAVCSNYKSNPGRVRLVRGGQ
jgi:hypothetical protein